MRERLADPSKRPPGSLPVELLLFSYPLSYPWENDTASGTGTGE